MNALQKKLHSNAGASMMMALLLMLVALLVSAVILSAAVSSAATVRADRTQQQTYLTVSSAAELLRDKITGGGCKYEKIVTNLYRSRNKVELLDSSTVYQNADGAFSKVLYDAIDRIQTTGGDFQGTYTISVEDYDPVTAEVLLHDQSDAEGVPCYRLTIWFTGGQAASRYRLCLTVDGIETTSEPSESQGTFNGLPCFQEVITTTVDWKNAKIQRKEAGSQ